MSPAIAGALGGTAVAAYLPMLHRQIRDGAIQIGHVGVRPVYIRRTHHPVAFRVGSCAVAIFAGLLLVACVALVIQGMIR